MKLGSLFGTPKPLASAPKKKPASPPGSSNSLGAVMARKPKPGEFLINWPKISPQQVKDYQPILTVKELESYCQRCQSTGLAGYDWETAADDETREEYLNIAGPLKTQIGVLEHNLEQVQKEGASPDIKSYEKQFKAELSDKKAELEQLRKDYLKTPLDAWKGEICTASLSAAPHEARVIPISHKAGRVFEPHLTREKAREVFLDVIDRMLFQNRNVTKIAVNLTFESKFLARYGRYVLSPVADPLMMWVRCLQVVAPNKIKDPKKPSKGLGLKPMTKETFGVVMNEFTELLKKHGVDFFDEVPADQGEGLNYSAEDSDYAVQHYLYWREIAKQIPKYDAWLHKVEMPFQRVIGLMEYWGMKWDTELAQQKQQEAAIMQEQAADRIKQIVKEALGIDVNPGATGKTNEVKHVLFDLMKLPAAKWGKTGASLDKEGLIDMVFMLENNLLDIDEEKYLAVSLPEGWEDLDPDKDPTLSKDERGAIRIAKREPHPYKEPGLQLLEQLKKIQKYTTLLSSHIKGREKYLNSRSGRIHAGYSTFTETSRTNSFNPNGQNVPRPDNDEFGIRNFFIPAPGKVLFFIDFSGFELRLMAWKSGDEVMTELFRTGGDMHKRTASVMTGKPESEIIKKERTDAKAGNFGISYGGTEHALQTTFKTQYLIRKTLDECLQIVNAVKAAYKRIPEYQREITLDAREKGFVQTIYGYIRLLPGINAPGRKERGADERRASNTPIQGSAADIMKRAQNDVYEKIGMDTYAARQLKDPKPGDMEYAEAMGEIPLFQHGHTDMIAQIHDEIIFEIDDDPQLVKQVGEWVKSIMEREPLPGFPVPIEAEGSVGYRWGDKNDFDKWLNERLGA